MIDISYEKYLSDLIFSLFGCAQTDTVQLNILKWRKKKDWCWVRQYSLVFFLEVFVRVIDNRAQLFIVVNENKKRTVRRKQKSFIETSGIASFVIIEVQRVLFFWIKHRHELHIAVEYEITESLSNMILSGKLIEICFSIILMYFSRTTIGIKYCSSIIILHW